MPENLNEFTKWYEKLHDSSKPAAPEIELDPELSEILPAQKHNNAKQYSSLQIALVAAQEGEQIELLRKELHSPSTFFHQFAAQHYAKSKKVSDEDLEKEIKTTVPRVSRQLIHAAVGAKRVKFLDRMFDSFYQTFGVGFAASILHGCSTPIVAKYFQEKRLRKHSHLNKAAIAKSHPTVLVDWLGAKLEKAYNRDIYSCTQTWSKISSTYVNRDLVKQLIVDGKQSKSLFDLYTKFTPCVFLGDPEKRPLQGSLPLESTHFEFPSILNQATFLTYQRENIIKFWKEKTHMIRVSHLSNQKPYQYLDDMTTPLFFVESSASAWSDLLIHALKLCDQQTILQPQSLERVLLKRIPHSLAISRMETAFDATFNKLFELRGKIAKQDHSRYDKNTRRVFAAFFALIQEQMSYAAKKSRLFWAQDYQPITWNKLVLKMMDRLREYFDLIWDPKGDDFLKEMGARLTQYAFTMSNLYTEMVDISVVKAVYLRWIQPLFKVYTSYEETNYFTEWHRGIRNLLLVLARHLTKVIKHPRFYPSHSQAFPLFLQILQDYAQWSTSAKCLSQAVQPLEDLLGCFEISATEENLPESLLLDFYSKATEAATFIFKQIPKELWQESAKLTQGLRIHPLLKYLPRAHKNTLIDWISEKGVATESLKQELLSYEDITNTQTRHKMEKATSSNNPAQRLAAYSNIFRATQIANDPSETEKTLKWLQKRLANETTSRRAEILTSLFNAERKYSITDFFKLIAQANSETIFESLQGILKDAIEASDLDEEDDEDTNHSDIASIKEHPVLGHFFTLSTNLIPLAYPLMETQAYSYFKENPKNPNNALETPKANPKLFEFAVDMQYQIVLFRKGERLTAQEFRIEFSPKFRFGPSTVAYNLSTDFLNHVLQLYGKYCSAKNPDWKLDSSYWLKLLSATALRVDESPLAPLARDFLKNAINESKKDNEGLCLWEENCEVKQVFTAIPACYWGERHVKLPDDSVRQEYLEALLHSRQAKKIAFEHFMPQLMPKNRGKATRIQGRQVVAEKLLSISESSIHIPFVWAFLLKHQQNRLTPFINTKKSFRGVFSTEPADRRLTVKKKIEPKKGLRVVRLGRKVVKAPTTVEEIVEIEEKKEKAMLLEVQEDQIDDHVDFWCLPACYDLKKLADVQSLELGKQWWVQTSNPNRAVPNKVTAIKRWTILPTTTYHDIVSQYEENEKKFRVNLLEALLRGTILNDEPTAPLHFLLSPKFLKTPRSRISVYAVSAIIPFISEGGLTQIIKSMLTGERRKALKITVFKELIRLLAATPSPEHVDMILYEWNRKELHRDIRIAILAASFKILQTENKDMKDIAWKILNLASKSEDPEIHVGLLCAKSLSVNPSNLMSPIYLQKQKIVDHISSFGKFELNQTDALQYVNDILLPLVDQAKDDDLQFLGLLTLVAWQKLSSKASAESAQRAYKFLSNTSDPLLLSEKSRENTIFSNRWATLAPAIFRLCGLTDELHQTIEAPAPKDHLVTISQVLCSSVLHLGNDQRPARKILLDLISNWITACPLRISEEDNDAILKPIVDSHLYQTRLITRRIQRVEHQVTKLDKDRLQLQLAIMEDIFRAFPSPAHLLTQVVNDKQYNHPSHSHWAEILVKSTEYDLYTQSIHRYLLEGIRLLPVALARKVFEFTIKSVSNGHFFTNPANILIRYLNDQICHTPENDRTSVDLPWEIQPEHREWVLSLVSDILLEMKQANPASPRNVLYCKMFDELLAHSNGPKILLYSLTPELLKALMHAFILRNCQGGSTVDTTFDKFFSEYLQTKDKNAYAQLCTDLLTMKLVPDFTPFPAYAAAIHSVVSTRLPDSNKLRDWDHTVGPALNFFLYAFLTNVSIASKIEQNLRNFLASLNPSNADSEGFNDALNFSVVLIKKLIAAEIPTQWINPNYKPAVAYFLKLLAIQLTQSFGNSNKLDEIKVENEVSTLKRVWRQEYLQLLNILSDQNDNHEAKEIAFGVSIR